MHEIRNKPIGKNTLRYRLSRLLVLTVQFLNTSIKTKLKPNTIEKIIEKEVEVEKIIEKVIYKDKIIHVDKEVPKETFIKEMVYVPLPTDNAELLKKGPFKASNYDKNKKK